MTCNLNLSNFINIKQEAYLDSGCTSHFLASTAVCKNKRNGQLPVNVILPNGGGIESTTTAHALLPGVSNRGRTARVFDEMNVNLISVGQLCDDGCTVTFTANKANVIKNNQTIMSAHRNHNNGMWIYNFHQQQAQQITESPRMNNLYEITKASELVKYLHAAAGFPVVATWIKAIQNNQFATWPGLTSALVYKHLPKVDETVKGHLKQQRQNVRSTQTRSDELTPPPTTDSKTHNVFAALIDHRAEIFTDATGPFPVVSSLGNKYVFLLYDYDSNYIMVQPVKDKKKATTVAAFKKQLNILKRCGLKPKLQKLDNEASQVLKDYITAEDIDYQLVPPHMHRRNLAERAIQTFKSHFIAMLCGCDPSFPLHLWCRMLPQAEITLNLLRTSRINPNLSAYAQIHGQFDYNRTPIAPPGTRVIVHENAAQRGTYGPRGTDGWYLGPAMDHYRCYRCYISATGGERTPETVEFFPQKTEVPNLSSREVIHSSALDLISAIKQPHPSTPLQVGNQTLRALEQLSEIFKETSAVRGEIIAPPRVHKIKSVERHATQPATLPRVKRHNDTYHKAPKVPPRRVAVSRIPRLPPLPKNLHVNANITRQFCANHSAVVNNVNETWKQEMLWDNMQNMSILPKIVNNVLCEKTGKPLTYRGLMKTTKKPIWKRALANEFGRLMQGVGTRIVGGTETLFPIEHKNIPQGRTAAYAKIVVDIRPQKKETHRARLVVGGDRVDYPYEVSTRTVDLDTTKMFLNSVISSPGARFMTMDIKDFYLGTPLKRYEYIRMQYDIIPQEIVEQYHLQAFKHGEYVYFEVRRGMYGLPQAGKIAYDQLATHLKPYGYKPVQHTPGLWRHTNKNISFILWVDDFGVKYTNRDDVHHLQNALEKLYRFEADWSGKQYIKIKLKWDYKNGHVTLSLPGYIAMVLERFRKRHTFKEQHSPHPYNAPKYGRTVQFAPNIPDQSELSQDDNKFLEQVLGSLLYYAMAIDCTMLVAINSVAVNKKFGMQSTMDAIVQLLDYAATHPDAEVTFHKSDMILKIHSDASYLSEYGARSRVGGYFFLGNNTTDDIDINGPIAIECSLLKNIVSSAAEAELGGVFTNATRACGMRTALEEMGHPQPATPICTDNTTAHDLVADRIKQRRSRAFDMRYFWVRDRVKQGQFHIYWRPGLFNLADYFTKHHPTSHHRRMRNIYLTPPVAKLAQAMNGLFCAQQPRGCINP